MASWVEMLEEARARVDGAAAVDPWLLRLERVRGKLGDDGIERLTTQTLFDHLEVLQRSRGAGACRRLATVMRDLGWTPVRMRDLTLWRLSGAGSRLRARRSQPRRSQLMRQLDPAD